MVPLLNKMHYLKKLFGCRVVHVERQQVLVPSRHDLFRPFVGQRCRENEDLALVLHEGCLPAAQRRLVLGVGWHRVHVGVNGLRGWGLLLGHLGYDGVRL